MKKVFAVLVCLGFVALAFWDVSAFIASGRRGLLLFANNVLPVLFPFFFVTSLFLELDFFGAIARPFRKVMKGVFGVSGEAAPVAVLSFIGGYPTGARMLAELYNRGQLSRSDAVRAATFTSTCSPIFIIATVGTVFLKSTSLGVLIFAAHLVGAAINGLFYRGVRFREYKMQSAKCEIRGKQPISDCVANALDSAVRNIFAVGGLIVIFFIAAQPFGVVITSVLEVTSGTHAIAEELAAGGRLASIWAAVLPCAAVSFGGLCVAMQGFVFLRAFKMPFWFYLLYKTTHAVIAVGLCAVLYLLV